MRLTIHPLQRYVRAATTLTLALLAACATYTPLPLDGRAALSDRVEKLDRATDSLPERLSMDDVVMLTLRNNPDLVAARAQRGLARAQVLAAGIVPNPSLSGSYGFLLGGPGTTAALAAGVSQDLKSLVTLSSNRASARHAAREIDSSLLWQEWQTIAKARLLAVDLMEGEKLRQVIGQNGAQLQELLTRNRDALTRGDTTLTALVPDLSAQAAVRKQQEDLERQQATRRRDLNVLLGLAPLAALTLSENIGVPAVDATAIEQAIPSLANRRPDLIALQLGYRSQEDKVRGAILAQFPMLSLGVSGGHDSTDVRTFGPQITLELPLFNRNQGNIAVERATRQRLHDEFTARLATAKAEIQSLLADMALLQTQLAVKQPQLEELQQVAARAGSAYRNGDLDERTYVDVLSARNAKQQDILGIEQILLEQQIAVATLVGAGMPPVTLSPRETK
ncbi:MAG: TolC family protein [Gammaproteobacteria bacterium]|nr:TolC family protein [Gammaproteobacteria bacterium]